MKIKSVNLHGFKRFSNLTIKELPESAKLVVLVGPNGSGKTSLLEAFNLWYQYFGYRNYGDDVYYQKKGETEEKIYDWLPKSISIEAHDLDLSSKNREEIHGLFYFRTAHRNEPDFTTNSLSKQKDLKNELRLYNLMSTDACVSQNYQRLVSNTIANVYNPSNDDKSVLQLREELIGKIRLSLRNVFEDLDLTSIGNPIESGSFYFSKGTVKDFHYKNLSAGEKCAFDLLSDLIINLHYFKNTVYCIDEPEAHMHTSLQAKLLSELYSIIPESGQLWISTHSLGMLKSAKELEEKNPGSVVFLDFTDRDFDIPVLMTPSKVDSTLWKKFLDLAFGELSNLIAPETVVFCEGGTKSGERLNFDADIYKRIFAKEYPTTEFVSVGSCSDVENPDNLSMRIVMNLLTKSNIIKLVDKDDKCQEEIDDCRKKGIKVLTRRHIESYLFDDELISLLCTQNGTPELAAVCLEEKQLAIKKSVEDRHNPIDDVKSASGDIMNVLKRVLKLTQCGNTLSAFLKNTMVPLITDKTNVYKELKNCIFE